MYSRPLLSDHARRRVASRRIPLDAVEAAIAWGREYRSHADTIFRLDRRSIQRAEAEGVMLDAYEGVSVVVCPNGRVRTAWKNRRPRRIQR